MNYLDKAGLIRLWSKITAKLSAKANTSDIPTKLSSLNNDAGYTKSSNITTFVVCTTAQYDASSKSSDTIYFITD